ncbi:hypothetical protein Q0Z83_038860 [Actinoplanes sichuanensis]|uniref:Uncharacterized protein n=1 Tax=Actinoplanes sichuanensis TaxID=512349 RepID=A0ABW4ARG0_9ACTN|nr:hypothetical protein [Actinoplanes sichuanensis]BEL05695.1 hypothetical protein Q0Z83_038860 [Actinoplanes sichuanensis]
MNRDALVQKLLQVGDADRAMVVDLEGSVVDVEDVRFDPKGNCVVIVLDRFDLGGAVRELLERADSLP